MFLQTLNLKLLASTFGFDFRSRDNVLLTEANRSDDLNSRDPVFLTLIFLDSGKLILNFSNKINPLNAKPIRLFAIKHLFNLEYHRTQYNLKKNLH